MGRKKRSAKELFIIDLMDMESELREIDEKGEAGIKEGFVDRFESICCNVNENCPKEKPFWREIKRLSKKLVKRGLFSSLW